MSAELKAASNFVRPTRRWPRWALACLLIVAALGAWFVWGVPPQVVQGPLQATRGPDGSIVVTGATAEPVLFAAHAGSLQANNNFSGSTGTASSDPCRFAARSAALFNESDHLLLQRVGAGLFAELQKEGFDELNYFPHGKSPAFGERLPDIVFTLDDLAIETGGVPLHRTLDAKIRITGGRNYAGSHSFYIGSSTPPLVNFSWDGTLTHQSVFTGVETSGAQFEAASANIVKELAERTHALLTDLSEKYGRLPELPAAFYPSYEAPPDFTFLGELKARKLLDGPRFMTPTDTTWQFTTHEPASTLLPRIASTLAELGWSTPAPESLADLKQMRAGDDSRSLEVFPDDSPVRLLPEEDAPAAESTYFVRYIQSMGSAALTAAVDQLLTPEASEDQLSLMYRNLDRDQQQRLFARFSQSPPRLSETWQRLAEWHHQAGQTAEAERAVLAAHALQRIQSPGHTVDSNLKDLAKKLEMGEFRDMPDREVLGTVGVIDLGTDAPHRAVAAEREPVVVLVRADQERQDYLVLRPVITPGNGSPWSLEVQELQLMPHGSGWSRRMESLAATGTTIDTGHGATRVHVDVRPAAAADRWEFEVISEAPAATPAEPEPENAVTPPGPAPDANVQLPVTVFAGGLRWITAGLTRIPATIHQNRAVGGVATRLPFTYAAVSVISFADTASPLGEGHPAKSRREVPALRSAGNDAPRRGNA